MTMTMHHAIRSAVAALVLSVFSATVLCATVANAATIYRETFGNADTVNRKTPNLYGWQAYSGPGALVDATSGNFGVDSGAVASNGKPIDVANINAGSNDTAADFSALAASRLFFNNTGLARFVWTPETPVNPALYVPGSIQFSFYLGNANIADVVRVAVRTNDGSGDKWYFSNAGFNSTVAVSSGANFQNAVGGAELKTLTYDPAMANWQVLTFDGTYDGGGQPSGPAAVKTAASAALSSPGAAAANLTGNITAFGLLFLPTTNVFGTNPAGNVRFDTYQIDATPIPEPASCFLAVAGGLALIAARRKTAC
jgi:hypothetical protein